MLVALALGLQTALADPSPDLPVETSPAAAPPLDAASGASTDPTPIVGPPAGPPLTGEALAAATQTIASLLRCPVCQGLSVADSPSESAVAIKHEVQRLAAKGYSKDQCLLYFEASYGEFILLEPKPEGLNYLVWAAPAGLVLVGLATVAWMRLGNRPKKAEDAAPKGWVAPPIPEHLAPYVALVYASVGAPPADGRTA